MKERAFCFIIRSDIGKFYCDSKIVMPAMFKSFYNSRTVALVERLNFENIVDAKKQNEVLRYYAYYLRGFNELLLVH